MVETVKRLESYLWGDSMRISKKAVIEAVKNNRTEDVSEVLEEFGLFKEAPPLPYSATAMSLATTILSVASAMGNQ